MFNCKKTIQLVSKKTDQKLSFIEKISLKVHLFICPPCANFETETEVISDCLKKKDKMPTLSEEKREAMEKLLNSNSK